MSNRAAKKARQARLQAEKHEEQRRDRDRDRERERRRLLVRRALKQRRVIALLCVSFAIVIGALVVETLTARQSGQVTGRLSGVRDLSFVEGVQRGGGVSPVCGCFKPPVDSWRGVSFAARQLTLARTGRAPWTEWALSGTAPEQGIQLNDNAVYMSVRVVRFRARGAFNPGWLLSGGLGRHGHVVADATLSSFGYTLLGRRPLHVAMLGPAPFGAWIPFPGSHVQLTRDQSQFPQDPGVPQLVETYPSYAGIVNGWANAQAYPLGDFLGPDLVLWANDPALSIPGTRRFSQPAGTGVITALLVDKSTYSTRIAAAPLTNAEHGDMLAGVRQHPGAALGAVYFGKPDAGGRVTVTLDQPLDAAEYRTVRRDETLHPTFWLRSTLIYPGRAGRGNAVGTLRVARIEERYPPLPTNASFNVFGPLRQLLLRGVRGELTVAGNRVDVSGSGDVELDHIRGLRNADDTELLSAPLTTAASSTTLQFRAVGQVEVNGSSKSTVAQQSGDRVTVWGFAIAVVSLFLALAAFLQGTRLFGAQTRPRGTDPERAQA